MRGQQGDYPRPPQCALMHVVHPLRMPLPTQVLDEAEETVALVLDADGALIGVLTKASVVEAISASKATDIASMSQ